MSFKSKEIESVKEYNKVYQATNKELLKEKRQQRQACPFCDKNIQKCNYTRHTVSCSHKYEKRKAVQTYPTLEAALKEIQEKLQNLAEKINPK